jgi:hypothetical protein
MDVARTRSPGSPPIIIDRVARMAVTMSPGPMGSPSIADLIISTNTTTSWNF